MSNSLQNASPLWKGPSPGWFVNMLVLKLQASAESADVFLLLECFSPTVVHPVKTGKEGMSL